jgi:signal transduction histidine kinase
LVPDQDLAGTPLQVPSVLLVDDDLRKLTALEVVLAPLELRLVKANSGSEALRRLLREDFALILLDVRMPEMDGFETASLIKQRARSSSTPIIFVTALSQAEADIQRGYAMGAIDFVTSPIIPELLCSKVEAIVGLQRDRLALLEELAGVRKDKERAADYLNMTAHEIRSPLAVISGYLAMLADGSIKSEGDAWQNVLEVLRAKTQAIDQLAADLLMAAKAEYPGAGKPIVDLNEEAMAACDRAAARAALLSSYLEFEGAGHAIEVYGDRSDVGRILDNLIGNAISYSPAGRGVKIQVIDEELPRVDIQDHGDGIPEDLWPRIFEPFFRVTPNREANGTGLGLNISRKLAERYGGRLVLRRSELGRGSLFALSLPRAVIPLHPGTNTSLASSHDPSTPD